jgi:integrase
MEGHIPAQNQTLHRELPAKRFGAVLLGDVDKLEFLPKNPAGKLVVPRSGKKGASLPLTPEQVRQIVFHLKDRDRLIVRMFLVLRLRPGEMVALRWNDKRQNCLRIDSSITDGVEVETKTEGSNTHVWLPLPST